MLYRHGCAPPAGAAAPIHEHDSLPTLSSRRWAPFGREPRNPSRWAGDRPSAKAILRASTRWKDMADGIACLRWSTPLDDNARLSSVRLGLGYNFPAAAGPGLRSLPRASPSVPTRWR